MTITTPTMGLQKPEVSITDGPAWATALNASLDTIDTHDHSTGQGARITPSGLNINGDLTFNSHFATNAAGYQFSLSAAPSINNVIYIDSSGSLRYKNSMGDYSIMNAMGEINGGITGDYTSTDADVNYLDATKTYRFWQDAGITANVDVGSINIYENVISANAVTLQSPTGLASAYSLTLPSALSGFNNLPIISSTAGVLSYNDQSVTTTSQPTFVTVNTGQGNNELYPMDQAVRTTDAVTFTTVNTGQGANELYAMNQNVRTTDSVTFANVSATLNSVDYSSLTQAEINQVANIDATTISTTQWGYLGALNQSLTTTSAVTFATIDTGQGANELYAMDQNVRTTDNVSFSEVTTNNIDSPSSSLNLRLNNIVYVNLDTVSFDGGGLDLGTSGNRWATLYSTDLNTSATLTLGTAGNADTHIVNCATTLWKGDSANGLLNNPGAGFFAVGNRGANFLIGEGTSGGGNVQGLFINQNVGFDGTNYIAHKGGVNTTQLRIGNSTGGVTSSDALVLRTNNGTGTGSGATITMTQVLSMSNDGGVYTKSGSSSSVGYGFELAKNSGMWRSSGGNLVFSRTGTDIFGITSSAGFAGTDNLYTWGTASFRWSDIYAVSGSVNTSDRRDKKRIRESDLGLEFLLMLEPKSFKYKRLRTDPDEDGDERTHYGFIAQDVRRALRDSGYNPDRVALFDEQILEDRENNKTGETRFGVRYTELIAPIISALQNMNPRIMEANSNLILVGQKLTELENRILALEGA